MSITRAVKIAFQRLAHPSLAEEWDNVGLLLEPYIIAGSSTASKRKVLLATDLTRQVVESMPEDVGSIVVYHPPIFRGLKSLTQADSLQASLLRCAALGISVYSPHTCLDAAPGGIQDWLATGLGNGQWQEHPDRPRVWELATPISLEATVDRIKEHLGLPTVQLARSLTGKKTISTIALCAGSGGSFLKGTSADLVWTGEMSHHEILAYVAEGHHVVLCTHTGTERPYLKTFFRAKLEETLNQIRQEEKLADEPYEVIMSEHEEEVIQYV